MLVHGSSNDGKRVMKQICDLTAIVLAGGKSSRMGQNKALLDWHGKHLIRHVVDQLRPVAKKVILVAKKPDDFGFLDIPCFKDLNPASSPAVGILTGLFHSSTEFNFILGCDAPFLNVGTVKRLYDAREDYDAVVPASGHGIEPLFGIYRKRCLAVLEEHLHRGIFAVRQILKDLRIKVLPTDSWTQEEKMSFFNMNTLAEYDSAQRYIQRRFLNYPG